MKHGHSVSRVGVLFSVGLAAVAAVVSTVVFDPEAGRMASAVQRSTAVSVGADLDPAGNAATATATVSMVREPTPALDCLWTDGEAELGGLEGHGRIVEFVYCSLLRRAPDPEGMAYWGEQLSGDLDVTELVIQVTGSNEYRNRAPGRNRWEDSPLDALAALVLDPGSLPAAERAAAPAPPPPAAPVTSAPNGPTAGDGFLGRQTISAGEFDRWVAERGLADTDSVTSALVHGRWFGDRQEVNVVYVHRSATRNLRVSPGDRGRATVGTWAREIGADVAVNGNWYAPWDGPAVSGGRVYGGSDHGYTALFGVTADGSVVLEHHREINEGVDPRVIEGVSGHPTLLYRGQRTTDFGTDPAFLNRHPRTAIGIDATGDILILVTVDGRSSRARGMTGDETARLLERLGARDAVMLDGGGSTTMWIEGRGVVNRPSGGLRAVGNQIAVFGS